MFASSIFCDNLNDCEDSPRGAPGLVSTHAGGGNPKSPPGGDRARLLKKAEVMYEEVQSGRGVRSFIQDTRLPTFPYVYITRLLLICN